MTELPGLPALGPLYARSLKALLPLPGGSRGDALPDRSVEVADVEVTADEVAAYGRVCGFGLADMVPLTYPHMLAFPLSVHLMVADDFPFALPGLVHVAQRIEQSDPVRVGDHLDVRVRTTDLRPHKRGRQFDVVAEVDRDGRTVWTGTSTYLRRGSVPDAPGGGTDAPPEPVVAEPAEPDGPPMSTWRLPKDLGKRYAAVSGDVNPIHLSPLTSRLGGFSRPIAHGMWTAARSVAALTDRITGPATLEVAFKQPVPLPSTVALRSQRTADGWTFTLHDRSGKRLHLSGHLDAPTDRHSKDQ
ncbi:MAG TPA: MaoC/PaaZ C-terminal domain-containing protein [Egicoccus sp.]|nr:MaoC/PaaZ C-terminal domain-containing protein [Egicoccus sp.]HSK22060.1 MaoC/PaaZ C-terminal domain-containing protein [Egicoccus sp.]